MRLTALLLAAALTSPGLAAAPAAREFTELPPGRYTVVLTGLLTAVCSRAIEAEWSKLPEVESVSVDFEQSTAAVSVRLDRTLKVASLRKALLRAETLANLGARYDLGAITYRLGE